MNQIVNSIKKDISELPPNLPICIYIAVGSAAHMVKKSDDNIKTLEDLYYHQYPKCIETINNTIPDMITFHILIDPSLESPPFMTIDKTKLSDFYSHEDILHSKNDVYHSIDNRHIVYPLRQPVTMACYQSNESIDITDELDSLNQLAKSESLLLVYHDFTGRSVRPLAEYFNHTISSNLDHIIYGIGSRGDYGCYIDLVHRTNQFAFRLEKNERREVVKVFNIYCIVQNNLDLDNIVSRYSFEHIDIITSTVESVLLDTIDLFANKIFYYMRVVSHLIKNKMKIEELSSYQVEQILEIVPNDKHIFIDGNYSLFFNKLIEFYSQYLNIIIYIKKLPTDNITLMHSIISEPNEYMWVSRLKDCINS